MEECVAVSINKLAPRHGDLSLPELLVFGHGILSFGNLKVIEKSWNFFMDISWQPCRKDMSRYQTGCAQRTWGKIVMKQLHE